MSRSLLSDDLCFQIDVGFDIVRNISGQINNILVKKGRCASCESIGRQLKCVENSSLVVIGILNMSISENRGFAINAN